MVGFMVLLCTICLLSYVQSTNPLTYFDVFFCNGFIAIVYDLERFIPFHGTNQNEGTMVRHGNRKHEWTTVRHVNMATCSTTYSVGLHLNAIYGYFMRFIASVYALERFIGNLYWEILLAHHGGGLGEKMQSDMQNCLK